MARLKSVTAISLIVAGLSLLVVAGSPIMRLVIASHRLGDDSSTWLPRSAVEQRPRHHPNDAQAWLALAVRINPSWWEPPRRADAAGIDRAFQHVIALRPHWAPGYLLYADRLLQRLPPLERPDLGERAALGRREPPSLTVIARARGMLLKARALDPENAAPDYLLAYLALMEHKDVEATSHLRAATAKPHWRAGEREAAIAVHEAAARCLPALYATLFGIGEPLSANDQAERLSWVVKPMALARERIGDWRQAVALRLSMMHLAALMAADGYTLIDVGQGNNLWAAAAGKRLTAAERAAVLQAAARRRAGESDDVGFRQYHAVKAAMINKYVRELRAHGYPDLADRIADTQRGVAAFRRRYEAASRGLSAGLNRVAEPVRRFTTWVTPAAFALGLLVICGLAYTLLMLAKRRATPLPWAWWKWALVVGVCAGLWAAYAAWYRAAEASTELVWISSGRQKPPCGIDGVVNAILTLPLAVWLVTWRLRRRRRRERVQPGFGRQYVGTLTAVLLPLTAVALLVAAVVAVSASAEMDREVRRLNVRIYRSELEWLDFKPPALDPGAARIADATRDRRPREGVR